GFPYQQTAEVPTNPFQSEQFTQNPGQWQNQPHATREKTVFDLTSMTYSQLLPYLVHNGMVTPKALNPMTAPFTAWYDTKAKCKFHVGAKGHSTDNCIALKHIVQELIDKLLLNFKEKSPNVKDSPLPGHAGSSAKAI
ncbi:gag-protease polyprotein, partial [Trifolium medium]|nr:gag-protease polyprotein [Trifolium medium]